MQGNLLVCINFIFFEFLIKNYFQQKKLFIYRFRIFIFLNIDVINAMHCRVEINISGNTNWAEVKSHCI